MKILTAIDLFCGCGGFTKGLIDAKINVLVGIDIWNKAIESYSENYNHYALCEDLTNYTPKKCYKLIKTKKIDLIVGGPPCQSFSIAGKRDKKDPRNSLFMEFYKYISYFKPKMFLMENVIGILSKKTESGQKVIDIIINKLSENYNCSINKLYASDFKVPQNRRRVIIVGIRKNIKKSILPIKTILEKKENVDIKCFLSEKAILGILKRKAKMKKKTTDLELNI